MVFFKMRLDLKSLSLHGCVGEALVQAEESTPDCSVPLAEAVIGTP